MGRQTDTQTRKERLRRKRRYLRCLRRRCDFLGQRLEDLGHRLSRSEVDRMREERAALNWAVAVAADAVDEESAELTAENGGRP